MFKESLLENLSIYNDNLSIYYLGSVFISILSVVVAWWYHKYVVSKTDACVNFCKETNENYGSEQPADSTEMSENSEIEHDSENSDDEEEILSKLRLGRQSLLAEKMAATMTEEQLMEEREVEKQQLEAIFELLQSQEDKFQVSSIQELQNQLRLYRN